MNEKINLKELTHLLAEKSGIQKKEAEAFLREYFESIDKALFDDQLVKVKNLGSFKLTLVNDRESVDVLTKERVLIPAHYKISYSPDNDLAQTVNEPFSFFETVEINEADEENESNVEVEEINNDNTSDDSQEIDEKNQPQETLVEIIKQPELKKRKKKPTSNRVFISCCIIVLLLGVGSFYYLNCEDIDIPLSVPSPDLTIEEEQQPELSPEMPEENEIAHVNSPDESTEIKQDTIIEKTLPPVSAPTVISESNAVSGKMRTIQSGERLTLIALEEYGNKSFWIYIYEENKSIIKNPNNVSSGLSIIIPLASKYGIDKNDEESVRKAEELATQYK